MDHEDAIRTSTYRGYRYSDGGTAVTVDDRPLDWRLDIANHSPSGLEWGYAGSGPAQLALALLADHFKVSRPAVNGWVWKETQEARLVYRVYQLHQPFKFKVVTGLDKPSWTLTTEDVRRVVEEIEQEQAASIRRPAV